MKIKLFRYSLTVLLLLLLFSFTPARKMFSVVERTQVNVLTPHLFEHGNSFKINFSSYRPDDYSFPLPVGKVRLSESSIVEINTLKGDAVKAMFGGIVRLSRKMPAGGNTIVIRHANGLETVYSNLAQNLVKVGETVSAGQTIAIVGESEGKGSCNFALMANGARINPETMLNLSNHQLRKQVLLFKKNGHYVEVSVVPASNPTVTSTSAQCPTTLDPDNAVDFDKNHDFKINLEQIEKSHWAYPLPGSHVISPYGGHRHHPGVDIKTCLNDRILAAFDGVVTRSCRYFGYGNCIVVRHAYNFETLYSHQSKNLVHVGDKVKAGQVIGLTGRTGLATTAHLHFEVHFRGHHINPAVIFDHAHKCLQQCILTLCSNGRMMVEKQKR